MNIKANPDDPASIPIACHLDRDTRTRYSRDASRIGISLAQYVRNALRAYGGYLDANYKLPTYKTFRASKDSYASITARITEAEQAVVDYVDSNFDMTRSQVLVQALHYYHTEIAAHIPEGGAKYTQKRRAPRTPGPIKNTISARLSPSDEKFLRAYAKVNEVTLSEAVSQAINSLRERELAGALNT